MKPVKEIGTTKRDETGTTTTFKPDKEIFKATKFNFDTVAERITRTCISQQRMLQ